MTLKEFDKLWLMLQKYDQDMFENRHIDDANAEKQRRIKWCKLVENFLGK